MGPLLPISILLGSMYLLDRQEGSKAAPKNEPLVPPRFSPLAVGRVCGFVAGVRSFHPDVASELDPLLRSSAVEEIDAGGVVGVTLFKLVPPTPGTATAADLIARATAAGHVVLGSIALALGSGEHHLLLVGGPDAKRYANARGQFALLADVAPPAAVAVEADEEEPVRVAPKNAIRKKVANGVTTVVANGEAAPAVEAKAE